MKTIIWSIVGALGLFATILGASAAVAYTSLMSVVDEAKELVSDIGDSDAVDEHVDSMKSSTRAARFATAHPLWRATEVIPVVGENTRAIRLLSASADDLVGDVAAPLLQADLTSIGPVDGVLNVDAVRDVGNVLAEVGPAAQQVHLRLIAAGLDTDKLLEPLQGPAGQAVDAISLVSDLLARFAVLGPHLPTMIGADEPRNYLVLVQNTAEARSLGGNPAVMLRLTFDEGRMDVTEEAGRFDVNTGRDESIVPLNPWTEELYTDRVGKWLQDITMTPDFAQTAHLARAFWEETLGDPGHAVLSIDPVALGYFIEATGPIDLGGDVVLTEENAARILMNDVYFRFPGDTMESMQLQDEFFGLAAGSIFAKLTSIDGVFSDLASPIVKAYSEGRLYYASTDASENKAIKGSKLQGPLYRSTNRAETLLGVFINDTTEGKLDYYTDMSVAIASDVCTVSEDDVPTFTTTATYNYNLDPNDVSGLPHYISTERYYPKGVKATDLVFYGPVGSTFVSAKVDGQEYVPHAGTNDLGRAAVRIRIEQQPSTSTDVEVIFAGGEGQEYGPINLAHTPMLEDDVPLDLDAAGCH